LTAPEGVDEHRSCEAGGCCQATCSGIARLRAVLALLRAPPNQTATITQASVASRVRAGCFSNRGIQPACAMLLEAVDVAAVKAIPKGARTA
jgi:hypothetical protein